MPKMENCLYAEQARSVCGAAAIRAGKFPQKTDFAGLCGESCGDRKRDLQSYFRKSLKYLARPARFERTAFGSGGHRSYFLFSPLNFYIHIIYQIF